MLEGRAKITGKGQVQIPVNIRKYIGADIGDNVIFKIAEDGKVVIEVVKMKNLTDIGGSLKSGVAFKGFDDETESVKKSVAKHLAEGE